MSKGLRTIDFDDEITVAPNAANVNASEAPPYASVSAGNNVTIDMDTSGSMAPASKKKTKKKAKKKKKRVSKTVNATLESIAATTSGLGISSAEEDVGQTSTFKGTLRRGMGTMMATIFGDEDDYSTAYGGEKVESTIFFTPDAPGGKVVKIMAGTMNPALEGGDSSSDEDEYIHDGHKGESIALGVMSSSSSPPSVPARASDRYPSYNPEDIPPPPPGRPGSAAALGADGNGIPPAPPGEAPNLGYNEIEDMQNDMRTGSRRAAREQDQMDKKKHNDEGLTDKERKERKKQRKKSQLRAKMQAELEADEARRRRRKPYFIILVSLVNVALLGWCIWENNGVEDMTVNPLLGPSTQILVKYGAKYGPCIHDDKSTPPTDQPWRFLTAMFLHVGIIHLVFNMSFQMTTGRQLEQAYGTKRFTIIYLVSGFGGNVFSGIFVPDQVSCGASSSLYGLIGVMLIDLFQNWSKIVGPWKNLAMMIIQIIISLGIGMMPGIDNFAHVGGFVTGILAGLVWLPNIALGKWGLRLKRILMVVSFFGLVIALAVGMVIYYMAVPPQAWCSWCENISCLEILPWCVPGMAFASAGSIPC